MTAKQKRIVKRKAERAAAWTIICAVEIILAAIPTAVLAALVVPFATALRGYFAYGGEWLAVLVAFYLAYFYIHKRVCDKIFGKEDS